MFNKFLTIFLVPFICQCENNGTCKQYADVFVCECPDNFGGIYCEKGEILEINRYYHFNC